MMTPNESGPHAPPRTLSAGPHADTDPGVPEALPRALIRLRRRIGTESLDRLWVFPPKRVRRRESGLVVASTYLAADDRRTVVSLSYTAVETGRGVQFSEEARLEGEVPPKRIGKVMVGVARRAACMREIGDTLDGDPVQVVIEGSAEHFDDLMETMDDRFLAPRNR